MNCSLRERTEPGSLRLLVGTESVVAQGDVFLKYSFTLMWSHGFVLLSKDTLNETVHTEYSAVRYHYRLRGWIRGGETRTGEECGGGNEGMNE